MAGHYSGLASADNALGFEVRNGPATLPVRLGRGRNESAGDGLNPVLLRSCVVSWDGPFCRAHCTARRRQASVPARGYRTPRKYHPRIRTQDAGRPDGGGAETSAAENGSPIEFARIATLRALIRQVARVFDPARKDTHWRKRSLRGTWHETHP